MTICYVTSRREPKIEWFFNSLAAQLPKTADLTIIVIDHFHEESAQRTIGILEKYSAAFQEHDEVRIKYYPPKPNVWNGQYRLTKQDWFAAASMRNTAICLCETSHICFVDDLSVLCPGWLDAVYEAVAGNYIGCGAYRKVNDLLVENGNIIQFTATDAGMDDRMKRVDKDVSECDGGWLYGCSVVAPLEDLLAVGGWPEYCDGLSSEDYCLGIALRNAGKHLKFDRRMMTLESDELHFIEPPMRRTDKGVSPNDKSHAALRIAQGSVYFPNYYDGGIRALRDHVLAGNPFPIVQIPTHDWFDGASIADME